MGEVRQLTVLGRYRYDSIPMIGQFVAEAAQAARLDPDSVFHCQVAVDEACTNIIEHAYSEQGDGNIEITCLVEDGRCTIEIVDHGEPFNPDSVPEPRIGGNLDDIEPGGIGLYLMRRLMDEIRFDFEGSANKLTMVKTRKVDTERMPSDVLTVREARRDIWVAALQGRLDAAHASQLEEALTDLLQKHPWLVVDMGQISYISSRGLKTLVSAWRRADEGGGMLVLCSLSPRVWTIFDTVGFTQVFDIYQSLDEALSAVESQKG
jgi:serine/threonine-protein kinase RsbW